MRKSLSPKAFGNVLVATAYLLTVRHWWAKQLKQQNIAEYLIYMWQVEDLIRAYGCDLERIRENLVTRYPAEQQGEITQWYEDLIEMMRREEVMQLGFCNILIRKCKV